MKGILKIYHPEETLKYAIQSTYCKAVYLNKQNFLEVEIITDDHLEDVEEDSLRNKFPQLALTISEFPVDGGEVAGKTFYIDDSSEDLYTAVDIFDDEEAFLFQNKLVFSENSEGVLELCWEGKINDFFTDLEEPIDFKLKCNFRQDLIEVEDEP